MQSGTPGFQAPEQLLAETIDVGADVYAFGALLIELFGEKAIWEGLTPYQKLSLTISILIIASCHLVFNLFVKSA